MDPALLAKKRQFEAQKARTKLVLHLCTICGKKAKQGVCKGCGTTAYCSTDCQRIDWRDRGHRKACKKIRDERAAEAARAEAPTPPPSPPKQTFYGPAPRSHADEVRARIAAEHEAARARREANPEREPLSARFGSRCPICREGWDVNEEQKILVCCCRSICGSCNDKLEGLRVGASDIACPLCRATAPRGAQALAALIRHVDNDVPEGIAALGQWYQHGKYVKRSTKKAAKLLKRAVELGSVAAMTTLGCILLTGGSGVKMDKKKAYQLFRMASDRGDAMAQKNLGYGLREDLKHEEAFHYFQLSADQGLKDAIYMLGTCYEAGLGAPLDVEKARQCYLRAAAKGSEHAMRGLERLASGGAVAMLRRGDIGP